MCCKVNVYFLNLQIFSIKIIIGINVSLRYWLIDNENYKIKIFGEGSPSIIF